LQWLFDCVLYGLKFKNPRFRRISINNVGRYKRSFSKHHSIAIVTNCIHSFHGSMMQSKSSRTFYLACAAFLAITSDVKFLGFGWVNSKYSGVKL